MTDLERTACITVLGDLRAATSARAKRQIIQTLASRFGKSESAVRGWLKQVGHTTGRAPRADRGATAERLREEVLVVGAWLGANRNKLGQPNMTMKEAWRLAGEQGLGIGALSYAQFTRTLNTLGFGIEHLCAPAAGITNVPDHANHVWLFDISVGIQWYFRDANGRRLDQYSDAGARFYAGKAANFDASRPVLHRFAMVDLWSGAYYVRYYYTPGERAEDVVDFWYHATSPKGAHAEVFPFRGLPRRVIMDQGPANKSGLVRTLLDELDVKVELHAPGNAKASGGVETRHNHWQRSFESRLRLLPAENLEEINRVALAFCAEANAARPMTRTTRAAQIRTPMELWTRITAEQLREPPERAVFFQLAAGARSEGTLDGRLYLRADGRTWQISGPHVHRGQKVDFRIAPFAEQGVRVWDKHGRELAALEIRFDAVSGLPQNGRIRRFDSEEHAGAAQPTPPAQQIAAKVAKGDIDVTLPSVFDPLARLAERQAYLVPAGQAWTPKGASALAEEPAMDNLAAREEVVRRIGRGLTVEERGWWIEAVGDGLTSSRFEELYAEFTGAGAAVAQRA